MDEISGQLRISILHPEEGISPLKCREWLQKEAASIQADAGEHDIIVIRLFLPVRVLSSITQRKIDVLLSAIVNKHPNIHRVELRAVAKTLTFDEMSNAADEARHDVEMMLNEMSPPGTIH